VRRCLVHAVYLSAPEVALSTRGAITNVELCFFLRFTTVITTVRRLLYAVMVGTCRSPLGWTSHAVCRPDGEPVKRVLVPVK